MNKSKYICLGIITVSFMVFCSYLFVTNKSYDVLDIKNIKEIGIDFNKNGVIDEGEYVSLFDGYDDIYSLVNYSNCGVNRDEIPLIKYLSDKFVKDKLLNKKVSVKKNRNSLVIYTDNINFNELYYNSGFLFKDGEPVSKNVFYKLLSDIKKSDYKIYNIKSKKYHNLDCRYGKMSHDFIYIPKSQLPRDAVLCKFCERFVDEERSADVKQPKLSYTDGYIKILATDFTKKLKPDKYGKSNICNELVKQINSAVSTIDIAIYGYDRVPAVEKALQKAIKRGVKVRLVRDVDSNNSNIYQDTEYFSEFIKNFNADYPLKNIKNPSYYSNSIMHDKFYIFDNKIVMTGSANLSATDMSGFNTNSVIVINSSKVADIYSQEFEQMYDGKFHNLKRIIDNKNNIKVGQSYLSVSFSPADKIIDKVIIPLLNSSKIYIYIPTFLITDAKVTNALISAHKRGVDIKVIIDATNAKNNYSKHKILRENGIKLKVENYAGKLHTKSIIVDDKYLLIGSMNLSKNGEMRNDENLVLVNNSKIAKFYKDFFLYLWSKIPDYWLTHEPSAESVYSIGSCSDGIDNDYDGLVDSADDGCKMK